MAIIISYFNMWQIQEDLTKVDIKWTGILQHQRVLLYTESIERQILFFWTFFKDMIVPNTKALIFETLGLSERTFLTFQGTIPCWIRTSCSARTATEFGDIVPCFTFRAYSAYFPRVFRHVFRTEWFLGKAYSTPCSPRFAGYNARSKIGCR